MPKRVIATTVASFTLLLAATVLAGPATDIVQDKQQELFKVVAKPKSDERSAELKAMFDEMLAYDRFATASLGDKWNDFTAEEQSEFSTRLTRLVRCSYKRNLTRLLDYKVSYDDEDDRGDAGVVVHTIAKHKKDAREADIAIDFRMQDLDGAWKATDIVTEGASLTRTYKSQFLKILAQDDGYAKLLKKMDAKIAKDGCD